MNKWIGMGRLGKLQSAILLRICNNRGTGGYKHDTLTDIIGYAACAEELASKIGCHYQKGETLHNTCNDDRDEEPKEEKP